MIILGKIIRYLDLSRLSENQNSLYIAIIKNIRIQKNKKIDTKKTLLEIDVDKAKNAGDGSIMSILSLIGIIYMAFSIVLILGDLFFHLGNVILIRFMNGVVHLV